MSVQNVILSLLTGSTLVSGLLIAAGWRQRERTLQPADALPTASRQAFAQSPSTANALEVAAELRDLLGRLAPLTARNLVRIELAVQPDIVVFVDPLACRQVLTQVVSTAITSAPGGKVLLSALRLGSMVHIAVSDDNPAADRTTREAALRPVIELISLRGGGLDIDARKGEGTTVVIRLPAATRVRPSRESQATNPTAMPRRRATHSI
jgi:signal transduction histidine kinase